MALTDHCDVFLSALEGGINRVLRHIRRQWPSMFNYGTQAVAENPQLLCRPIDFHPVVPQKGNPIITVMPPVPVVGTLYGLDYCAQITEAAIDLSPGNVLALPPELGMLGAQRLAAKGTVCGALACPPNDVVDHLPVKLIPPDPPPAPNKREYAKPEVGHLAPPNDRRDEKPDDRRPPIEVIPTRSLRCFCLDGFVIAGARFAPGAPPAGKAHIVGRLDGIEVVDVAPDELESAIECYGALVVKLFVFPQLALKPVEFVQDDLMGTKVTIAPSPTSPSLPNNPAIEDDLLKAFLKLDLTIPPPAPPGGGGGGPSGPKPPPLAPGVDVPRIRSGPFDLTIALSAGAVTVLFNGIRDAFTFSKSDSASFGPFTMGYAIGVHLEGGTIELRNDGSIRIKELDIKWDTAKVWLGIDIPEICVGGFCIIPNPLGGCAVRAPKICVFSANPDIGPNIDISGLITSEISATVRPKVQYSKNHAASMNAWDAKAAQIQNRWIVIADIIRIDFDLFDIADIVGDLLHNALESAVNNLLGGLPGWAKSLILAIIGPIIDFVTDIIDLPDDIGEWLEDKLGVTFGLLDLIITAVADHLAKGEPLIKLEDPVSIESPTGLIDLMVPVEFLDVRVNEHELIVEGDIGG